mmetsp:Transcript_3322/g.7803  ORF Transcript_3322/g.7803 Transcript_3322/m.7803 type:complete len:103 (-) Transcript_3322:832-1140(-)
MFVKMPMQLSLQTQLLLVVRTHDVSAPPSFVHTIVSAPVDDVTTKPANACANMKASLLVMKRSSMCVALPKKSTTQQVASPPVDLLFNVKNKRLQDPHLTRR